MIYLWSGTPGSGKTLHMIQQAVEEFGGSRPIYQYGIRKCKQAHWQELTKEQVLDWESLPDGSIVLVDEAWQVWPSVRSAAGKGVVDSEALRVHRHRGFDFILTSQAPKQLHHDMRELVNRHTHVTATFGTNFIKARTWDRCCDDPDDWGQQQDASTKNTRLPKKYFDYYESAEIHTKKIRAPWQLWAVIAVCLVLAGFAWKISNDGLAVGKTGKQEPMMSSQPSSSGVTLPPSPGGYVVQEHEEWIPGIAQRYQTVIPVNSFPRPQCMRSEDQGLASCRCYSQQGTRMTDVSLAQCNRIVEEGYFDPSVDDRKNS